MIQDEIESEARRELEYEEQRARNTGPHEYSAHDTHEGTRRTRPSIWPDAHHGSARFREITNFALTAAAVEFPRNFLIYGRGHVQTRILRKTCPTDPETNKLRIHVAGS